MTIWKPYKYPRKWNKIIDVIKLTKRQENQQKGTMQKLLKLIDKLEEELIYINGAFDHIKSHVVDNKDQPIMSASTLTVDLSNGVNLINKIIEEKNKGVA